MKTITQEPPVYILTYNGRRLSGFYPNDIPGVFAFRKNDWYIFHSQEEAQKKLDYIRKEVHDPHNVERYGDFAAKHSRVAKGLAIKQNN